jgi:tRNA(Glu) U13 pseudouridine synthase TruD
MTRLTGPAGLLENRLLEAEQLSEDDLQRMSRFGGKGSRRSLRCRLRDLRLQTGCDDIGQFIELGFELNSGCYATSVLREIIKTETG